MAKSVLDEIIKDNMTDYEKELAIYEWMVENIGKGSGHIITMPGQNSQAFTPHEVLKSHSAVCVGYATTFRLLANMVGLEVHIVHNDYHSWDMVKLDDGEWYQLDIYSDVDGARYRNFNMTDEMARSGHEWDGSALPEAKGTKYSYAVQNAVELADLYELPKAVKDGVDAGKGCIFVSFEDGSALDYNVTDMISPYVEGYYIYAGNTYSFADGTMIYSVTLEKSVESVTPEEPPYDYDKMQKKLEEVFGVVAMG